MNGVKLAIIGSRTFSDYQKLKETLEPYKEKITLIISGGAKGADSLGERWAKENNIQTKIFYPEWEKYGKSAGFIRNELIISESDAVIAFWDGISNGTKNSLAIAEKQNKKVKVVLF